MRSLDCRWKRGRADLVGYIGPKDLDSGRMVCQGSILWTGPGKSLNEQENGARSSEKRALFWQRYHALRGICRLAGGKLRLLALETCLCPGLGQRALLPGRCWYRRNRVSRKKRSEIPAGRLTGASLEAREVGGTCSEACGDRFCRRPRGGWRRAGELRSGSRMHLGRNLRKKQLPERFLFLWACAILYPSINDKE